MSIQDPRREGEDVDLVRHLEDDQVDDPLNHQLYLTLMSKLTRTFIFTFVYIYTYCLHYLQCKQYTAVDSIQYTVTWLILLNIIQNLLNIFTFRRLYIFHVRKYNQFSSLFIF